MYLNLFYYHLYIIKTHYIHLNFNFYIFSILRSKIIFNENLLLIIHIDLTINLVYYKHQNILIHSDELIIDLQEYT